MKLAVLSTLFAFAASAYAHSEVFAVFINGVDQGIGKGTYIRSPANNSPVKDLSKSDVACNNQNNPVSRTLQIKANDVVTFEWHHESRTDGDQIVDPSHKGPVLVYIAPTESMGAGPVWVKLFEENYSSGSWAVDKLIAARGQHSVVIPDLKPGKYLLRPELVTLHEADTAFTSNPARGVQLYMECIQFEVVSSGSLTLPAGASFPGEYKYTDRGILFSLYDGTSPASYKAPGPAVWSGSAGGSIGKAPAPGSNPAPTTTPAAPTTTPAAPTTTPAAPTTTAPPAGGAVTTTVYVPTTTTVTVTVTAGSPAAPTTTSNGSVVQKWGQCGGATYNGSTNCISGTTCQYQNDWYSQCL